MQDSLGNCGPKVTGHEIVVTMSGNVASNGYFNSLLLSDLQELHLPIRPTGDTLRHAFSQPSWELDDLTLNDIGSIDAPMWSSTSAKKNSLYVSDRSFSGELFDYAKTHKRRRPFAVPRQRTRRPARRKNPLSQRLNRFLGSVIDPVLQWLILRLLVNKLTLSTATETHQPTTDATYSLPNARRSEKWIHISIGPTRYPPSALQSHRLRHVLIEHGTLRWSHEHGSDRLDKQLRRRFRTSVHEADHLWVTNLDHRTLELATTYCEGRWSAFPHPYRVDSQAPYQPDLGTRESLQRATRSDFLILSGSSLNLKGGQYKGVHMLLDAMKTLRHDLRLPVGLILVDWGQDAGAVRELCRISALTECVTFIPPMSRIRLMKTMAACDLISDQFSLDAFGALSLRAWEQGMPILSRPISSFAATLIGARPPVVGASSFDEIVSGVDGQFRNFNTLGRSKYLQEHCAQSRNWFLARHHHTISQKMQLQRYRELFLHDRPPAMTDLWARTTVHFDHSTD